MTVDIELLCRELSAQGMELTPKQKTQFVQYSDLLLEWNEKINLTAITAPEEVAIKHFYDSAMLVKYGDLPQGAKLMDVGTGAGFPGIPCKLLRPDLQVTLLDSLNKRVNFLKEVGNAVGEPLECIHARAEDGGRNKALREQFPVVTARAVANLAVLCEYCMPFVAVGGVFAALKGPDGKKELEDATKAIFALGGQVAEVVEYLLPDGSQRCLVLMKKISQTPTKYPRSSAKIAKEPL